VLTGTGTMNKAGHQLGGTPQNIEMDDLGSCGQ